MTSRNECCDWYEDTAPKEWRVGSFSSRHSCLFLFWGRWHHTVTSPHSHRSHCLVKAALFVLKQGQSQKVRLTDLSIRTNDQLAWRQTEEEPGELPLLRDSFPHRFTRALPRSVFCLSTICRLFWDRQEAPSRSQWTAAFVKQETWKLSPGAEDEGQTNTGRCCTTGRRTTPHSEKASSKKQKKHTAVGKTAALTSMSRNLGESRSNWWSYNQCGKSFSHLVSPALLLLLLLEWPCSKIHNLLNECSSLEGLTHILKSGCDRDVVGSSLGAVSDSVIITQPSVYRHSDRLLL